MKKPRAGVLCRVSDRRQKIHSKSLRGTFFMRVNAIDGVFSPQKKNKLPIRAARRASRMSVMKVAFMASIPSIALRR
ncbi:MAG: hypothetical protein LBG29_02635 [Synergistaceae bacterium]|nr:hypothetical protein [Synergistaceae bacterium]